MTDTSSNTKPTDREWHIRENTKFIQGDYIRVPWCDQDWYIGIPHHYAHTATQNKGAVAFTSTNKDGRNDKQTTMRPGRYLKKFYPSLSPTQIETEVARFNGVLYTLELATTAHEIEQVYRNGPRSCMSYAFPDLEHHPTRAYASGDLGVYYYRNEEGKIAARTLARIDKEPHVAHPTMYGNYQTLKFLLKQNNIEIGDNRGFTGTRLICIPITENIYLCPYLDIGEIGYIDREEQYIYIGEYTPTGLPFLEVDLCVTEGLTGLMYRCEDCEGTFLERFTNGLNDICDPCYNDRYVPCDTCSETTDTQIYSILRTARGLTVCETCYENGYFECVTCWKVLPQTEQSPDNPTQCLECLPSKEE